MSDGSVSSSSSTETITLQVAPTYDTRTSGGSVWATFATSPVFPSDTISVNFYAHTNGLNAAAFELSILFDESVLTYVSNTASSSFTSPTVLYTANYDSGNGLVGAAQTLTENFVTGESITLITITFRVVSSPVLYGPLTDVLSYKISNFYADTQQDIVTPDTDGTIDDYLGTSSAARMLLYERHVVGIFATPATGEMINLNVFASDTQSSTSITVNGIYSNGDSLSLPNTYLTCTSTDTSVVQISSACAILFGGSSESSGSSSVSIVVT
jgi:hypothetical protein